MALTEGITIFPCCRKTNLTGKLMKSFLHRLLQVGRHLAYAVTDVQQGLELLAGMKTEARLT